jgi:hypothetical protein
MRHKAVVMSVLIGLFASMSMADTVRDAVVGWGSQMRASAVVTTAGSALSNNMAVTYLAMYDAINANANDAYTMYGTLPVSNGARADLAAHYAAHAALTTLYPSLTASFDTYLAGQIAGATLQEIEAAQSSGQQAFSGVQARRAGATPATPFHITNPAAFLPTPPPSVDSSEYAAAYEEVRMLGRRNGSTRDDSQTAIALFWREGSSMILRLTSVAETAGVLTDQSGLDFARAMATFSASTVDIQSVVLGAKLFYNTPRPITAIRAGDADANLLTIGEANWESLGTNIPAGSMLSYPSGGASFGGLFAALLADMYGTDLIPITIVSTTPGVLDRSYDSLSSIGQELGLSRLYNGEHFRFDVEAGGELGRQLGLDFSQNFLPIPEPSALSLAAIGFGLILRRRR